MNRVCVSGRLLNTPRYDVIPSTGDAVLRALLEIDGTVLPILCCNECACYARKLLADISLGQEVYASGEIKGNYYTDAVGSKNYLLYLMVSSIANSHSDLLQSVEFDITLEYKGFPFNVADIEDILKYMEA